MSINQTPVDAMIGMVGACRSITNLRGSSFVADHHERPEMASERPSPATPADSLVLVQPSDG